MTIVSLLKTGRAVAVGGLLLAAAVPALAQDQDFSGQRIEMVVPFAAGGGSSAYAQFMSQMLTRTLPGNPSVVVRNIPGGGSITGTNEFVRQAEPDGLTIATTGTSGLINFLLSNPAIQFTLDDLKAVIASPAGVVVYVHPELGINGPADIAKLRGKTLTIGCNAPTAADLPVLLSLTMLGIDINAVFGIDGGGPRRQGFERGEFDINFDTSPSYVNQVQPLVDEGSAVPLFTFGIEQDDGTIVRDPGFPDVPTFLEFYEEALGAQPTGPEMVAWRALFSARVTAGKVIVLPGNTPENIVQTYIDALNEIVKDPDFTSDQGVEIVGTYEQPIGAPADRAFKAAGTIDDDSRTWLIDYLRDNFDVEL
jgi:tripartite-type tricarboxylate transporter receptor subunit TctC